jgi:hypothetical protein
MLMMITMAKEMGFLWRTMATIVVGKQFFGHYVHDLWPLWLRIILAHFDERKSGHSISQWGISGDF